MISFCRGLIFTLFCLLLIIPASQAAQWTVYPTGQTNCTGSTDYAAKYDGTILIDGGETTGPVRKMSGFLKFDVSSIPDTISVSAIAWHYYVDIANYPYWSVTPLTADPASLVGSPAVIWEDLEAEKNAGYYNYQNEGSTYWPGWHTLILGGTANDDLTTVLSSGQEWFAFGGTSRDGSPSLYQGIHGHNDLNVPYLVVHEVPPPANDTCAGAVVITPAPGTVSYTGDTTWASNDYNCTAACVGGLDHDGNDLAYSVTLPIDCEICVSLGQAAMAWNGGVYMVTDCLDPDGTCVAGASGWLAGGDDETFCFRTDTTETYYLIVDGRTGGNAGLFQLDVDISCLVGPSELVCVETPSGVDLSWTNNDAYEFIEVYLDGMLVHSLPGAETVTTVYPEPGYHCIHVCGTTALDDSCSDPCCLIFGYEQQQLLWDFEADDGGFMVQGTGAWEWGEPTYGPCKDLASGKLWATSLHQQYSNNACWLLDSQPINLGGVGHFLSIDHCYDSEFGEDGGTVWFTTDDFWYNTSEPVNGADGRINGKTPLCAWVEGQKGFTGNSGGWVTDNWDLTGETWESEEQVTLRFAFASDSSITAPGWMIDNITLFTHHLIVVDCNYVITPTSGTVPFSTQHQITIYNNYTGGAAMTRRFAGRIAVSLAGGASYNPWRAGFTNIAPSSYYTTQFPVNFPALGALIGSNSFTLTTMDVTPAPYNQPPYPASGSTCNLTRVVVAYAP